MTDEVTVTATGAEASPASTGTVAAGKPTTPRRRRAGRHDLQHGPRPDDGLGQHARRKRTNALAGPAVHRADRSTLGLAVTNADVEFQTDEPSTTLDDAPNPRQANSDASTFTASTADLSSRPVTVGSVTWSPRPWSTRASAAPPSGRRTSSSSCRRSSTGPAGLREALVILVSASPPASASRTPSRPSPRPPPGSHPAPRRTGGRRGNRARRPDHDAHRPVDSRRGARLRISVMAVDLEDGKLGAPLGGDEPRRDAGARRGADGRERLAGDPDDLGRRRATAGRDGPLARHGRRGGKP